MRIKLEVDNTGLSENVLHCSFAAHYLVHLLLVGKVLLWFALTLLYSIFLHSIFYVLIPGH